MTRSWLYEVAGGNNLKPLYRTVGTVRDNIHVKGHIFAIEERPGLVCRRCLDVRVEAERGPTATWRSGCIRCCPICEVDRAFNMGKLVKNMALANVLAEIKRLMDKQPDNGDNDHSNGGVNYKDEGTKRKRREE